MSKNAVSNGKLNEAAPPLFQNPSKLAQELSSNSSPKSPPVINVGFSVGPNKEVVGAVRSSLMKSSPKLKQLFKNYWDHNFVENRVDIPLPHINPTTFKILLKLLRSDAISSETSIGGEGKLVSDAEPEQLFGLISISKDFHIEKLQNHLELFSKNFFETFEDFIAYSPKFLHLSSQGLRSMLSSVWIPLDEITVFNITCMWAKYQCVQQELEINGPNIRSVLEGSLYEIRFPLMTAVDFSRTVTPTNILTDEEAARVLGYLVLNEEDRDSSDVMKLGFQINPRQAKIRPYCGTSRVSIFRAFPMSKILSERQVCDEKDSINSIRPSSPIELLGMGFLGPIDGDAEYMVNVDVSDFELKSRIPAKKCQIFYFMFQEPLVVVEEIQMGLSLQGPATQGFTKLGGYEYAGEMDEEPSVIFGGVQDGIRFNCEFQNTQIVELVFRRRRPTGSSKPT